MDKRMKAAIIIVAMGLLVAGEIFYAQTKRDRPQSDESSGSTWSDSGNADRFVDYNIRICH